MRAFDPPNQCLPSDHLWRKIAALLELSAAARRGG